MKGNLVFYTGLSRAPALTRIAPAFACNCARFIHFLQTLRVGALRRALLFLAAPRSRRVRPLLTTEEAIIGCDSAERGRSQMWFSWKEIGKSAA